MSGNNFGRYDGICILMTAIAISSFFAPVLFFFADFFNGSPVLVVAVLGATLTAGFTVLLVALLVVADMWLLLGNVGLSQRLFMVCLINIVPCAFFCAGAAYALARLGSEGEVVIFVGMITQRLIVLFVVGALSLSWQAMSRWRIAGPVRASSHRRAFQMSIGDVMMCTALIAAILVCATFWIQIREYPSYARRPFRVDFVLPMISAAAALEILGLLIFLLLPFALAYGAPWIRRHYAGAVALWILLTGIVVSMLTFFAFGFWNTKEGITVAVSAVLGHAGFAGATFVALSLAKRSGFGIVTHVDVDTVVRRSLSKLVPVGCLGTLLSIFVLFSWFDLPTLLHSGSLSMAHRVSWMSYEVGAFPRSLTGDWGVHRVRYGKTPSFLFTENGEQLARLIQVMVPRDRPVELSLRTASLSRVVLDRLKDLSINHLSITCETIDTEAFREFCKISDAKSIRISDAQLSTAQLAALRDLQNLRNAELVLTIPFHVENQQALHDVPKTHLNIQLEERGLRDVSMLQDVEHLTICNSTLMDASIEQLKSLNLKHLVLEGCFLDEKAVRLLASMTLQSVSWNLPSEDRGQLAAESLLPLAASRTMGHCELDTPFDLLFQTKFINRSGGMRCDLTGPSEYGSYFHAGSTLSLFNRLLRASNGDVTSALEKMATDIVRDEASNIVELDLQQMPLMGLPFDELPELKDLRRLRVGHSSQSRRVFDRISKLDSLRELEISGYALDNLALKKICKLSQLRKLQLPLSPAVNCDACRKPERMPIFDQGSAFFTLPRDQQGIPFLDLRQLSEFMRMNPEPRNNEFEGLYSGYGNWSMGTSLETTNIGYEEMPIRSLVDLSGFASVSELKHLEYLFMPGYLLTEEAMDVLEELPKLKHLHAVFSFVRPRLLEEISKLNRLESLSLGVGSIDQRTIDSLSKLQDLRELQLVVFNSAIIQSPQLAARAKTALRQAMPNCRIHLIHLHRE